MSQGAAGANARDLIDPKVSAKVARRALRWGAEREIEAERLCKASLRLKF